MKIELISYKNLGSMYVAYPDGPRVSCYENTLITVLREDAGLESVEKILSGQSLQKLIDEQRILLLFPNPQEGKWDITLSRKHQDQMHTVMEMVLKFNSRCEENDFKPYHNMHNARYYMGIGTGASLAQAIAAVYPVNVAGIFTIGGELTQRAMEMTVNEPVPAILWNAPKETQNFFKKLNRVDKEAQGRYFHSFNEVQFVSCEAHDNAVLDASSIIYGWNNLFSKVCRMNSSFYGQLFPRTMKDAYRFVIHENDTILGDGQAHTWFEYIPEAVKREPGKKLPFLMFLHGGADSPANIANSIKLHELAEEEGFILVYPAATDGVFWNQDMDPRLNDDCGYLEKLLDYMLEHYPIDTTRIYVGGFSNGSSMSQVFAMTHPDRVAAIFANNSASYTYTHTRAFNIAGAKKLEYDYRMPVWYTYGSRDIEFPVVRGTGQQNQYDFWKGYNNISIKLTPYANTQEACGAGLVGELVEFYQPSKQYPENTYMTNRFYSNDPDEMNLYNYTLAYGKGHDSVPYEGRLGWRYIRQFRRMPNKTLEYTPNKESER